MRNHSLRIASAARLVPATWRPPPGLALAAIILSTLILWEVTSRTGLLDASFASRPTDIVAAIPQLIMQEAFRKAVITTLWAMLAAFMIGTTVGIALGYAMGMSRLMRDAFLGPALFLLAVPKSIFIPVFLVLFGIHIQTTIFYGAFSGFIYVLVNVVGGFDLVQRRHLLVADAYGASLRQRFIHVILPSSTPGLFTGIWYGMKNALNGVLIMELFISLGGVGGLMVQYSNELRVDRVFALVLGLTVFSISIGSAWAWIERHLNRWRPKSVGPTTTV